MKPAVIVGALVFIAAGTMHFVAPSAYVKIMPPALPAKELLVAISGAAEIAGGIGLLVPALRFSAAMGLIALLVAVFPANIYWRPTPQPFPACRRGRSGPAYRSNSS
jgi:uncharacterized membrane protein